MRKRKKDYYIEYIKSKYGLLLKLLKFNRGVKIKNEDYYSWWR